MKISLRCSLLVSVFSVACSGGAAAPDAGISSSVASASAAPSSSVAQLQPVSSSSGEPVDTGPPWFGLPALNKEKVAKTINPKDEIPYSGKTGNVHGRITIKGDPPPATLDSDGNPFQFTGDCASAASVYQKLFRVDDKHGLGDAMVAITEYSGFVPAKKRMQELHISKCAYASRTVIASFGQRLEVSNKDNATFIPYLDGAPFRTFMAAIPGGKPIRLYPVEPGHYLLRDQLKHPFLMADVFVVPYATFDVTSTDGRYLIENVPVGKAKIDAFLPAIAKSVGKSIDVKEGDNTFDIELSFDAKKDKQIAVPPPVFGERTHTPGADASAAPSASVAPPPIK